MNPDALLVASEAARVRARRAYELGLLRRGVLRAGLVTALVGGLAAAGLASMPSLLWLGAIFAAWLLLGVRGSLEWRGAVGGMGAGLLALVLPMSVLRPCCTAMTHATSCSMPQLCVGAGALLGAAAAAALPRVASWREWSRAAGGALLGIGSLVACRCAQMFVGEAVGLLGGLLASAGGIAVARALWARRA